MKLKYAILLSLVCHFGTLGYFHLVGEVTVEERSLPTWFERQRVEFEHVPEQREPEEPREVVAELEGEALAKALRGDAAKEPPAESTDQQPEAETEPKPEPAPKQPVNEEPEPKAESAPSEKEVEPAEETEPAEESEPKKAPKPVVAEKSEDAQKQSPDETARTEESNETSGPKVAAKGEGAGHAVDRPAGDAVAGARGSSEGSAEGSPGTRGGGKVDRGALMGQYGAAIYRYISKRKTYPRFARRAGIEGMVKVTVHIDADGRILEVSLAESSGHKVLDRAALKAVRSMEKLPTPPKALALHKRPVNIPIRYDLDRRG